MQKHGQVHDLAFPPRAKSLSNSMPQHRGPLRDPLSAECASWAAKLCLLEPCLHFALMPACCSASASFKNQLWNHFAMWSHLPTIDRTQLCACHVPFSRAHGLSPHDAHDTLALKELQMQMPSPLCLFSFTLQPFPSASVLHTLHRAHGRYLHVPSVCRGPLLHNPPFIFVPAVRLKSVEVDEFCAPFCTGE